jgi:cyclophilin family peptidyl-prolyl cis-trans isomerase
MKRSGVFVVVCAALAWGQESESFPEPDVSKLAPGLYALFATSMGNIVAELFEKEVHNATLNWRREWKDPKTKKMVNRPLYRDLVFHRVIPYFMVQSGDPTGVGNHDCGFFIPDEIKPDLKFDRPGRLAMASLEQPNTASCQFFITETAQPRLDGRFTIFGQVVEGQDVVGRISRVIVDSNDKPRVPIRLHNVTILRIVPKQPAAGQ